MGVGNAIRHSPKELQKVVSRPARLSYARPMPVLVDLQFPQIWYLQLTSLCRLC